MLTLRLILWTLAAPLALWRGPLAVFAAWRPRRTRPDSQPIAALVARADRVLLFRMGGKLLFRTRCLKRTLVLFRLLRLYGHPAVAYIGLVTTPDGARSGHAWLCVQGERIPDPDFAPGGAFTAFYEIGDETNALRDAPATSLP